MSIEPKKDEKERKRLNVVLYGLHGTGVGALAEALLKAESGEGGYGEKGYGRIPRDRWSTVRSPSGLVCYKAPSNLHRALESGGGGSYEAYPGDGSGNRHVHVVVCDLTDALEGLASAKQLLSWCAQQYPEVPLVLVGTKSDRQGSRMIESDELQQLATEVAETYAIQVKHCEVSSHIGNGMPGLYTHLRDLADQRVKKAEEKAQPAKPVQPDPQKKEDPAIVKQRKALQERIVEMHSRCTTIMGTLDTLPEDKVDFEKISVSVGLFSKKPLKEVYQEITELCKESKLLGNDPSQEKLRSLFRQLRRKLYKKQALPPIDMVGFLKEQYPDYIRWDNNNTPHLIAPDGAKNKPAFLLKQRQEMQIFLQGYRERIDRSDWGYGISRTSAAIIPGFNRPFIPFLDIIDKLLQSVEKEIATLQKQVEAKKPAPAPAPLDVKAEGSVLAQKAVDAKEKSTYLVEDKKQAVDPKVLNVKNRVAQIEAEIVKALKSPQHAFVFPEELKLYRGELLGYRDQRNLFEKLPADLGNSLKALCDCVSGLLNVKNGAMTWEDFQREHTQYAKHLHPSFRAAPASEPAIPPSLEEYFYGEGHRYQLLTEEKIQQRLAYIEEEIKKARQNPQPISLTDCDDYVPELYVLKNRSIGWFSSLSPALQGRIISLTLKLGDLLTGMRNTSDLSGPSRAEDKSQVADPRAVEVKSKLAAIEKELDSRERVPSRLQLEQYRADLSQICEDEDLFKSLPVQINRSIFDLTNRVNDLIKREHKIFEKHRHSSGAFRFASDLDPVVSDQKLLVEEKKPVEDKKPEYPAVFYCPLTKRVMVDPVTIETGETFERNALLEAFEKVGKTADGKQCHPLGKDKPPLSSDRMIPNIAFRGYIEKYKVSGKKWDKQSDEEEGFLLCPVNVDLFEKPILNMFGQTYSAAGWAGHVQEQVGKEKRLSDPLTGQLVTDSTIQFPNIAMQELVGLYQVKPKAVKEAGYTA